MTPRNMHTLTIAGCPNCGTVREYTKEQYMCVCGSVVNLQPEDSSTQQLVTTVSYPPHQRFAQLLQHIDADIITRHDNETNVVFTINSNVILVHDVLDLLGGVGIIIDETEKETFVILQSRDGDAEWFPLNSFHEVIRVFKEQPSPGLQIQVTEKDLKDLRIETGGSYSFNRYRRTAWNVAIRSLANFGYTKEEIRTILESKLMRWAADQFGNMANGSESLSGREIGMYIEEYPDSVQQLFDEC